ncbi:DNA phosphorothioation-dependent restriction protein DptG (plasmid) [Priestia megaterium]|uniref:DNA phosphorothioation-dependent restriction protein DptG n=1 Tax=Priestia megaterium TaxID=1404 RepID=UPI000D3E4026|nr:DNA phosphorothioation-dependent restriction protein DptG [Priestia megaterium]AWD68662.1 DNA phosphorothioation-dependent restriction protein DptG [Priestia megaterium]
MNLTDTIKGKISNIGDTITWEEKKWSFKLPSIQKEYHERTLDDIFPFSPVPLKREEMWAGIINKVLDSKAELSVKELLEQIPNHKLVNYDNNIELKERLNILLEDLYLIESRSSKSTKNTSYILPFHIDIIKNVKTGNIRKLDNLFRLLLIDENGSVASDIFEDLVNLLKNVESLTPLDNLILNVLSDIKEQSKEQKKAYKYEYDVQIEGGYQFVQKQGQLFRRDMRRIIEMQVSNIEKIRYFTILIGIHFSLYLIRVNYFVDDEVQTFFGAINGKDVYWKSITEHHIDFQNKIPFTFRDLKTPLTSNPVVLYREMQQKLYIGYINMVFIKMLRRIAQPVLGKDATLKDIWFEMSNDEDFKIWIEYGMEMVTKSYLEIGDLSSDDKEMLLKSKKNWPECFHEAVKRHYARKKPSDRIPNTTGYRIINHYTERGSSFSFLASKGGVGDYYAMGQELLILLVHLIVKQGDKISYKNFLKEIKEYGFVPESNAEPELLKKLDEVGLLQKFSDSGDAIYVRTIF